MPEKYSKNIRQAIVWNEKTYNFALAKEKTTTLMAR